MISGWGTRKARANGRDLAVETPSELARQALGDRANFVVVTADWVIAGVSQAFCDLTRFGQSELIGKPLRLIASDPHSALRPDELAMMKSAAETDWRGELQICAKDGAHHWMEATVAALRDSIGAIAGYMVLQSDVTRYKTDRLELQSDLELLNATFEHFPGGISYVTKDLVLKSANELFYSLLELPKDRFPLGSRYEDVIRFNAERGDYGEGDPDEMVRERVVLARQFREHAFERKRPNGTSLEIRGYPLPEGGFVSTYVDITARTGIEAMNTRLARIVEDSFNEVYVFDAETLKFLEVNKSACKNLGYTREELMQLTPLSLKPSFTFDAFQKLLAPLQAGEQSHTRIQTVHRRKDQSIYNVEITLQQIRSEDRPVFAAIVEDVTEKRNSQRQIAYLARHDVLTSLPNRTFLKERLRSALADIGPGAGLAVIYIDLDRFTIVNDTLGHAIGDELLGTVAKRLLSSVRASDTVARLGNDEFAIIQFPTDCPEDAAAVACRLAKEIEKPFSVGGQYVSIDTSIGIATAPKDGVDPESLLYKSALAMSRAKTEGGGKFVFFEPGFDTQLLVRQQLEFDLKNAMSRNEFELVYQPIVRLDRAQVSSLEALLRWRHPERGLVSPLQFIPIAEETGLIRSLGEWVLHKACADASHWPDSVKVAVNLSPVQFQNPDLASQVAAILAEANFPGSRLELEITESTLMHESEQTLATLHQLRDLGAHIAMDDFGAGYSSLGYLRSFPFDKVKIDRSFIEDIVENEDTAAIVQAIAGLCTKLGILTTAEGVETDQQLALIRTLGCTHMQGYFFSPPKPADQIAQLYFQSSQPGNFAA